MMCVLSSKISCREALILILYRYTKNARLPCEQNLYLGAVEEKNRRKRTVVMGCTPGGGGT